MKKNVLLLINGFGVAQSGSYDIYDSKLMPNMDKLTKENLFISLSSHDYDYKSGYRNFSIGVDVPLTYTIIENNISNGEYKTNQLIKYILNESETLKSKLHVFCYWENEQTINHLLTYLKEMSLKPGIKIFVHLILCQKSLNDYKNMANTLTRVNYELGEAVKLGIVTGENNLSKFLVFKDYIKMLVTEAGEKWKDMNKKVEVLYQSRTLPYDVRTFAVTEGFKLDNNDQLLFFNYSNVEVSPFNKEIALQKYSKIDNKTLKYYSLFPVKSEEKIPFAYNFAISSTYAFNSLKSINAKCLIMDIKEKCPFINYYFMGLRNEIDPTLGFLATDNGFIYEKDKLFTEIKKYSQELIIINYEIDTCKTVEEIEDRLRIIDDIIGEFDKMVKNNEITLFISSLYGIEKELYNDKHELCKINFSVRVPLIVDSSYYPKTSYSISEGTVYDLSNTIFYSINSSYKGKGLIRRKSSLFSFLYKKPKEVKNEETNK